MPYGPNRQPPKERPLTEAESEQRVKELQAEQARTLRRALGDRLYDWIDDFEQVSLAKTARESTIRG